MIVVKFSSFSKIAGHFSDKERWHTPKVPELLDVGGFFPSALSMQSDSVLCFRVGIGASSCMRPAYKVFAVGYFRSHLEVSRAFLTTSDGTCPEVLELIVAGVLLHPFYAACFA